ncbi:MAG: hypothetical protein ACP5EK_02065 [Thermoplasmatota archaeon]
MRFAEMDRERLREEMRNHFIPAISIAKGYLELAIEDEEDGEQEQRLEQALHAIMRVERVLKNMMDTGEIHD